MAKRKKPRNRALAQEEIWDDSALIESWNEAAAEYEFYHSIAAKGEDVEEVLRQAELDEQEILKATDSSQKYVLEQHPVHGNGHVAMEKEELEDGEVDEIDPLAHVDNTKSPLPQEQGQEVKTATGSPAIKAATATAMSPIAPVAASGSDQDQVLENIKMAYYWAGYYSGLYEGQRQRT